MTLIDRTYTGNFSGSTKRRPFALYAVWGLVIGSLLPWRSGAYYSGGLDPVVVAKGALTSVAFCIILSRFLRQRRMVRLGARTPLLILAYVAVTWLGGLSDGALLSSGVLGARLLLTGATVALSVLAYSVDQLLHTLATSFAVIGAVLAASGVQGLATKGRLYSSILPVSPNQIALLLGLPTIWLVWRMLQTPPRLRELCILGTLLGLTWLTGSRTGLLAIAAGIVIVLVHASHLPRGAFFSLLAVVPGMFYVLAFTGVVTTYVYRDGAGNVMTLNSRTIAWQAVFQAPTEFWQQWFGGGLAVKTVGVSGQYWSQQVLDSSWVSAFSQAGIIGFAILVTWCVGATVSAFRVPRPYRGVIAALVVSALIRSVLENGLLDSYTLFITMLVPALASELVDSRTGKSPLRTVEDPPVASPSPGEPSARHADVLLHS